MKCNININEKVFNKAYIPHIDDQTPLQMYFGGKGSGKSVFVSQRLVTDLMKGNRNYLVIRNVGRTHRESTFAEIGKVISGWKLHNIFNINKSDLTITQKITGCQALFAGLDDVQKCKSITPSKPNSVITDIWIEEAFEIKKNDFDELGYLLRGGDERINKRITLTFNPMNRIHWICKEYFKDFTDSDNYYKDNDKVILRTTYKDNRFLTKQDIRKFEEETSVYYKNVYTLGLWGVLGELIFTHWKTANLTGKRDAFGSYCNGLDWGYTNDPAALARCAIKGKTLYITHGFYEYGMENEPLAKLIKPITGKDIVRCGLDEPKSIQELRGCGINAVKAHGGPGSVMHGIKYINQFDEVIIHYELQDAINEFQTYQWEKNRDGEVMNVPIDRDNHYIDALRYALSGVSFMPEREESNFDYSLTGLSR